jgi:hypothetical protein
MPERPEFIRHKEKFEAEIKEMEKEEEKDTVRISYPQVDLSDQLQCAMFAGDILLDHSLNTDSVPSSIQ